MHDSSSRLPYLIMAVFSAVLMGTIGVISKYSQLPAETITFYRLLFGVGFLVLYLLVLRKSQLLFNWPSWQVLLNGGFLAAFIVFYVQAMNYTSMANAIMMVYLAPVAASVFAHLFLNEKLNRKSVLLILLALFGFAMMMEFRLEFGQGSSDLIGLGYASLALITYASFILVNRTIPSRVHVYTRSGYQLLVGAICMLPFMLQHEVSINMNQWGWLIAAGLFPGFLAILFAVVALRELPAATFGTLAYIEPIAVVSFGWVLFDQSLNTMQISGCILIMLSGVVQAILMQRQMSRLDP